MMNLLILKSKVKSIFQIFIFIKSVRYFRIYRETPLEGYFAMRKLYSLTNGRFNNFISWLQVLRHPKYSGIVSDGVLGKLSATDVKNIAHQIKEDGYCMASKKIDKSKVDRIIKFCKTSPTNYLKVEFAKTQELSDKEVLFNNLTPISPVYRINMQNIFRNSDLLQLVLDQSLLAVAQEYLGCIPILDLVQLWWSVPFDGKGTSEAAQEYHYDMDRIKFLKIFIYLTDVGSENGPHCYIKGSHIRKPKPLLLDRRKSDSEIEDHYPKSQIRELHGCKGTIIFADTSGFHKGKPLTSGHRLLLVLEYSNSSFGKNYPKVKFNEIPNNVNLSRFFNRYPRTYNQILDFDS